MGYTVADSNTFSHNFLLFPQSEMAQEFPKHNV